MAIWILALAVLLAFAASRMGICFATHSEHWRDRRLLLLATLWIPGALLGILVSGTAAMALFGCPWFTRSDRILLAAVALLSIGALLFTAVARWFHVARSHARLEAISEPVASGAAAALLFDLAKRFDHQVPGLRMVRADQPVACTYGWRRPTVLLSSWILDRLDEAELEAVLAHELAHLVHRDPPAAYLAAWLRDTLFFLPDGWGAWGRLTGEREIACDALATEVTGRPGAMASALLKVGTAVQGEAQPRAAALGFGCGPGQLLESRMSFLLGDRKETTMREPAIQWALCSLGILACGLA
ncbi:MAG: M56 family metallopeptidase, partial [Cyanobacteria bacterium REEB65]|nr:M56 family metallopeptidase [Cyanobacteria bacterium REEB65]